ncbi:odorant receptor 9a-like [Vespula maculifrons]|uniref:Odorant receptor 9a-like n=1 Tax=Vespula maculifrons TaxID=7453 RepID=A0ABD2BPK1_VESMC
MEKKTITMNLILIFHLLLVHKIQYFRLTEELESNFNYPIMQQLMGSSVHICIAGFYVLTVQIQANNISNVMEDTVQFILFIAYFFSVISTLFIYCFIGECFIQEVNKTSIIFCTIEISIIYLIAFVLFH